jgi:hypothetical protein
MKSFSKLREHSLNETKSAPKGFHFTKDGKLKRGDADVDGPGGAKLRSDPLDKLRSKVPPVSESTDDEGAMARGQLMQMVSQASMLARMMDDNRQLDGWVQSKLTMAADYLDSVHDYLMHNQQDVEKMDESEVIVTPKRTTPFGNPPPGTIAHDQMMGKYKQLRKAQKEREAKKEKVEEAKSLDKMSSDELNAEHKKVQDKINSAPAGKTISMNHPWSQRLRAIRLQKMFNGKKMSESVELDEAVKTTHEDPLVTVHQDGELHTHANLSTANNIFNTNVKHTDVHKGPVTVTSGREDKKKLKFAISMHHQNAMKEETELQEGDYSVTVSHRLEGKTTKHEYTVKNAQSPRHAKHIAMQKHEKKIGPLKPGEQFSASNMDVKEL